MPLQLGDVVIARFPWEDEDRATRSRPRPCLVIDEGVDWIEVAYGTSSPDYTERYNAQIIRHDAGEIGAWPPGAFVLRRRRILPKTREFFPEGVAAVATLSEAKRARAQRALEEIAALEKWETAKHGSARRTERSRQQGMHS